MNSVNPFRLQGQKTLRVRDRATRSAARPTCTACRSATPGNISSHWLGYSEYLADGVIHEPPRLFGFQAAGAAPLVRGRAGEGPAHDRDGDPDRQPRVVGHGARGRRASRRAAILAVTDREILAAYRRVAREGLFAEPASAASVAGLLQLAADGPAPAGATVVCVLTGHGLKDPEWAITGAAPPPTVPADAHAVAAELGL